MLTVMNTLLRKAIERSNIHPYYIDEISSRYALMIETWWTRKAGRWCRQW